MSFRIFVSRLLEVHQITNASYAYSAAAPLTISIISLVIAA